MPEPRLGADGAEDEGDAAGHVLERVRGDPFDDDGGSAPLRVLAEADAEPVAAAPGDEDLAAAGPVAEGVADDGEGSVSPRRQDREGAAVGGGEAGVGREALELEVHAFDGVSGIEMARRALVVEGDGAFGETEVAFAPRDLPGRADADAAVFVGQALAENRVVFEKGSLRHLPFLLAQGGHMVGALTSVIPAADRAVGGVQDLAEVDQGGFTGQIGLAGEEVATADDVFQIADAVGGHRLADLLGDEEEVAADVLALAREPADVGGVLGGDAGSAA